MFSCRKLSAVPSRTSVCLYQLGFKAFAKQLAYATHQAAFLAPIPLVMADEFDLEALVHLEQTLASLFL